MLSKTGDKVAIPANVHMRLMSAIFQAGKRAAYWVCLCANLEPDFDHVNGLDDASGSHATEASIQERLCGIPDSAGGLFLGAHLVQSTGCHRLNPQKTAGMALWPMVWIKKACRACFQPAQQQTVLSPQGSSDPDYHQLQIEPGKFQSIVREKCF